MARHDWQYDPIVSEWLCRTCGTATDYCEQVAARHDWFTSSTGVQWCTDCDTVTAHCKQTHLTKVDGHLLLTTDELDG